MTVLPDFIRITGEHIETGERGDCSHCPIATAILSAIGTTDSYALVRADWVFLRIAASYWWAWLPEDARDFIERFDDGLPVEPFGFGLTWKAATS